MKNEKNLDLQMQRLNSLANAINKAHNKDMRLIWTKQWNKLVKQYAMQITNERE